VTAKRGVVGQVANCRTEPCLSNPAGLSVQPIVQQTESQKRGFWKD
jgi:hypothetical protein